LLLETDHSPAGLVAFIVVGAEANRMKKLAMAIETDHPLGRMFDIDVFDEMGNQLSRENFGAEKRTCLICGGQTALCRRSGRHSVQEVLSNLEQIATNFDNKINKQLVF
jgi:holo-ACP synthase